MGTVVFRNDSTQSRVDVWPQDEQRSALLLDNCIGVVTNIAKAYCAGLLDREQSLSRVLRSLGALVRAELRVKPTHSSN